MKRPEYLSVRKFRVMVGTLLFILALLYAETVVAQPEPKSLLWKIEGKGIQPSYLFGTFHILSQSDFKVEEKIVEAFKQTEQLVLELKMDDPMMQIEMMKYITMKDGMTIDRLLDSAEYRKLDEALKETAGMGIQLFNTFKPLVLGSFLILQYIDGPMASFELTLVEMAKDRDIEIKGLETVAYQMALFDMIPYEEQAKDLMEMVLEEERMTELFDKMIGLYKEEDMDALFELTLEDASGESEIEILLLKRNREWIRKIEELSKEKTVFFAVGAAHLGGNDGLVQLLKRAGYTVKPVLD